MNNLWSGTSVTAKSNNWDATRVGSNEESSLSYCDLPSWSKLITVFIMLVNEFPRQL